MTSHERRELTSAVRRFGPDVDAIALRALCHMAQIEVPERKRQLVFKASGVILERVVGDEARGIMTATLPLRAQPKPQKRHIDRGEVIRFRRSNPTCILTSCGQRAEAHHVKQRGAGGSDDERNLLNLCPTHHTEWHHGRRTFVVRYLDQLPIEALEKIRAAFGPKWGMS